MGRIIKAPNIQTDKSYDVVERHKVLKHANEEAAEIVEQAQMQEEEILRAAAEQADEIIASANEEAEAKRAEIAAEVEQAKTEGIQQGIEQGTQQGLEQARTQAATMTGTLKTMMQEGQKILEGMFVEQERDIRQIVCEVVQRVVQKEIEEDHETVVRVTQECIRMAADRQHLTVLIHPDDKATIEAWVPDLMKMFDDVDKITVEVDPRVGKGGVIVESGVGGIDGRIEKQVDIMQETISEE